MLHYKFRSSKDWCLESIAPISRAALAAFLYEKHRVPVYILTPGDAFRPDSWIDVSSVRPKQTVLPLLTIQTIPKPQKFDVNAEFGPDVYSSRPLQQDPVIAALLEVGTLAEDDDHTARIFGFLPRLVVGDPRVIRDIAAWVRIAHNEARHFEAGPGFVWSGLMRVALGKLERAISL